MTIAVAHGMAAGDSTAVAGRPGFTAPVESCTSIRTPNMRSSRSSSRQRRAGREFGARVDDGDRAGKLLPGRAVEGDHGGLAQPDARRISRGKEDAHPWMRHLPDGERRRSRRQHLPRFGVALEDHAIDRGEQDQVGGIGFRGCQCGAGARHFGPGLPDALGTRAGSQQRKALTRGIATTDGGGERVVGVVHLLLADGAAAGEGAGTLEVTRRARHVGFGARKFGFGRLHFLVPGPALEVAQRRLSPRHAGALPVERGGEGGLRQDGQRVARPARRRPPPLVRAAGGQ